MSNHVKTKDRIKLVTELSAFGADEKYIASKLEISVSNLKALYADELAIGSQDATIKLVNRLYTIAMTGEHRVSLPAIQFWLKCKAGWREPPREVELSGKGGKDLNFVGRDELLSQLAKELEADERKSSIN